MEPIHTNHTTVICKKWKICKGDGRNYRSSAAVK